MTAFKVGDRVTVQASEADPIHIVMQPHVVIAAVVDRDEGPAYLVEHTGVLPGFPKLRWGPFVPRQLKAGW